MLWWPWPVQRTKPSGSFRAELGQIVQLLHQCGHCHACNWISTPMSKVNAQWQTSLAHWIPELIQSLRWFQKKCKTTSTMMISLQHVNFEKLWCSSATHNKPSAHSKPWIWAQHSTLLITFVWFNLRWDMCLA